VTDSNPPTFSTTPSRVRVGLGGINQKPWVEIDGQAPNNVHAVTVRAEPGLAPVVVVELICLDLVVVPGGLRKDG